MIDESLHSGSILRQSQHTSKTPSLSVPALVLLVAYKHQHSNMVVGPFHHNQGWNHSESRRVKPCLVGYQSKLLSWILLCSRRLSQTMSSVGWKNRGIRSLLLKAEWIAGDTNMK